MLKFFSISTIFRSALTGAVCLVMQAAALGQVTYTWNASLGAFNTSTNWTPTRTSLMNTDKLVFNGSVTPNATISSFGSGGSTAFAQLRFINGINATIATAATLSPTPQSNGLAGSGNEPFFIDATSTVRVSGTSTCAITIPATNGGQAYILGSLVMAPTAGQQNRIQSPRTVAPKGIVVGPGGRIFACPAAGVSGSVFGPGSTNTADRQALFMSGAKYYHGIDPGMPIAPFESSWTRSAANYNTLFALTAPAQQPDMAAGSEAIFYDGGALVTTDRSYGDLTLRCNSPLTLGIPAVLNNLNIKNNGTANQFLVPFVGSTALNITGNLTIDSDSGGFSDSPTAARTLTVTGTTEIAGVFSQNNFSTLSTPGAITVSSGGTLNASTNAIAGVGSVTIASGGTLNSKHVGGVNGQIPGSKTLSSGGNYGFNGTAAQVTGAALPANVNSLTINNAAGVSLSAAVNVNNLLALTAGNLTTGLNALVVGISGTQTGNITGTGFVVGALSRHIAAATGNYNFPVTAATINRSATVTFTAAPSVANVLTAQYVASDPGTNGLPLVDGALTADRVASEGFWTITGASAVDGTYNLTANVAGIANISDPTQVRIAKRANSSAAWGLSGSAGASNVGKIVQTVLSGFSDFAIVGANGQVPVSVSSFTID